MKKLNKKSVFILVGMPGSGKSTFARKITKKFGAEHLSSDKIRDELFKSLRYGSEGHDAVNILREKAHTVLYDRAINFLKDEKKVIIDATHLDPKKRKLAVDTLSIAVDKSKICFAVVSTSVDTIEKRMKSKTNEVANETETMYQGWKRVTDYFLEEFKSGKLNWPSETEGIDFFDHKELEYALAK